VTKTDLVILDALNYIKGTFIELIVSRINRNESEGDEYNGIALIINEEILDYAFEMTEDIDSNILQRIWKCDGRQILESFILPRRS
jgi:tRNA uridine 5-carbamoylmethylation protein Kti12